MAKLMNNPTSIAGWIVCVAGRDVAAGPTRNAALRTARELGVKGGDARAAGAREIDDLDLPDVALGIGPEDALRTDGGRWWATGWCGIIEPDPEYPPFDASPGNAECG